jgi:DNA-binding transcriptional LysR family regulator
MSQVSAGQLTAFRSLVFVIESGSFTQSARKLGLSPSGLSKQISRLEESLGVRLLERTTRSVRATGAGRELYQRVRPLFEAFADAEAALRAQQGEIAGLVRVSAAPALGRACVLPVLSDLANVHPKLSFDVVLTGRRLDFFEDGIDLAIREGELSDSTLTAQRLGTSDVLLYAAPDYLRRRGRPRRLEELPRHDLLALPLAGAQASRLRTQHPALHGLKLNARFQVDDLLALQELAVSGMGIAALPDYLARAALTAGQLTEVLPRTLVMRIPLHVVYPSRRHLSQRLVTVIDALRARLRFGRGKSDEVVGAERQRPAAGR